MKDISYKLIGRSSLIFDYIRPLLASERKKKCPRIGNAHFDKTGLVVKEATPMEILWKDFEILYVKYDSLAHSFWRAQEFSLFMKHQNLIVSPFLDFGCGDGSFASVLFKEVDCGVDNDPEGLLIAERFGIYKKLLQSSDSSIPVEDAAVQSVISNSVLEHLTDLDSMLSEIRRILMRDGTFIFTVPVLQFRYDLEKYFGRKESERINIVYYHRNLLEVEQWRVKLENHGFSVVKLIQYQPDWFTFWYRMFRLFGERGLGYFLPGFGMKVYRRYESQIIRYIKKSINETKQGANIFVIAKKKKSLKL